MANSGLWWSHRLLAFVLLSHLLFVSTAQNSVTLPDDGTTRTNLGDDALLEYGYTTEPGASMLFEVWKKMPSSGIGNKANNGSFDVFAAYRGRVEPVGEASLRLLSVTKDDAGEYQLSTTFSDGTSDRKERTLIVQFAPEDTTVTATPGLIAQEGVTEVLLTCQAGGIPAPTYTWTGANLPADAAQDPNTGTLTLTNIQRAAAGQYTCTADNGVPQLPGDDPAALTNSVNVQVQFHNNKCYRQSRDALSHKEAAAACVFMGGQLVDIKDPHEQQILNDIIRSTNDVSHWTFMKSQSPELLHIDGSTLSLQSSWMASDIYGPFDICVLLDREQSYKGDFHACTEQHNYFCESPVIQCQPNVCQNGGFCKSCFNGSPMCACSPGYTGVFCETDINECASNPCQNGGTCHDHVNSFACFCRLGYDGDVCENDIDYCATSPCPPGWTCVDQEVGFHCDAGYQLSTTLGSRCLGILTTCPSHRNLAFWISVESLGCPHLANQTFTTNLSFGVTGHELDTTSSLENMTTTLPVVKTTAPAVTTLLQDGTTPVPNVTTTRTVVTTELKAVTTILMDMITTYRECLFATGVMKRSKILGNTNQDTSTTRKTSRIGCRQVGYKLLAGTCIRLNLRKLSYKTARKTCKKDGARLAMPETEELDLALRNLVQKEGHNINFWIGLRNKGGFFLRKRHWLWEDGSKLGHYKVFTTGEQSRGQGVIYT
uniref:C-type lectin domain-containing protein n=1 Tax=Branchiostoma floridae TaxID=7739 RepID=C3YF16_BRAFL|eukprot:XP_002605250.1 hypothetical protein BRAFLDRAFT_92276 [Branchiostoma floridae]